MMRALQSPGLRFRGDRPLCSLLIIWHFPADIVCAARISLLVHLLQNLLHSSHVVGVSNILMTT